MNRRKFLAAISCLPFLGWLKPAEIKPPWYFYKPPRTFRGTLKPGASVHGSGVGPLGFDSMIRKMVKEGLGTE